MSIANPTGVLSCTACAAVVACVYGCRAVLCFAVPVYRAAAAAAAAAAVPGNCRLLLHAHLLAGLRGLPGNVRACITIIISSSSSSSSSSLVLYCGTTP